MKQEKFAGIYRVSTESISNFGLNQTYRLAHPGDRDFAEAYIIPAQPEYIEVLYFPTLYGALVATGSDPEWIAGDDPEKWVE